MAKKKPFFSQKFYAAEKRRNALKYAERQLKRGNLTPHTVAALRNEARRLERLKGITGQGRISSDKQLKRMTGEELRMRAQEYEQRIARAQMMPNKPRKKKGPEPEPAQSFVPPYGMPEKFGAWDDFKDWLAENGIILDPSDPNYRKMLEYSKEIGDTGMFSRSEQFRMLQDFYRRGLDIEDVGHYADPYGAGFTGAEDMGL